jgi:NAD(P)-dependent dehydrogenase (short-subunit alcohol dehydrogenase family)
LSGFFDRAPDPDGARAGFLSTIPLGRFGQVGDIANAALYLASGDSGWVTGTGLVVDGGVLAT